MLYYRNSVLFLDLCNITTAQNIITVAYYLFDIYNVLVLKKSLISVNI